jgi:hypothetical protein
MKLDKADVKQLIIIIIGVLAGLFGYDVVTDDDSVTIALPAETVEAAPVAEAEPTPAVEEAE